MFTVYKITNLINNKIYIGQTTKTIQERWKSHLSYAKTGQTHFARAIRKYGKENFKIEAIDTSATNQDELNKLENYYIHKYDAIHKGYNILDAVTRGGDSYSGRIKEEMDITKQKLSESKKGGKNPNATKIKCKNIDTEEELFFDSCSECQKYFNEKNHNFITRRASHKTKYAYKGLWIFAYQNDEYMTDYTRYKNNRKAQPVRITNNITNETKDFPNYTAGEKYFGVNTKTFSGDAYKYGKIFTVKNFTLEKL